MPAGRSLPEKAARVLALCLLVLPLAGCGAGVVVSQTVRTTAKAAGTAARVTMDGARATSSLVTRPFRRDRDEAGDGPEER